MAEELIPVNIQIADRAYRIRTSPKDEESVRKTVKIINDKLVEFKSGFAGKDMQDYVSMVILWYATQNGADTNPSVVFEQLTESLSRIEAQLDKVL